MLRGGRVGETPLVVLPVTDPFRLTLRGRRILDGLLPPRHPRFPEKKVAHSVSRAIRRPIRLWQDHVRAGGWNICRLPVSGLGCATLRRRAFANCSGIVPGMRRSFPPMHDGRMDRLGFAWRWVLDRHGGSCRAYARSCLTMAMMVKSPLTRWCDGGAPALTASVGPGAHR